MRVILWFLLSSLITSCANKQNFAPVASSHYLQRYSGQPTYVVKAHDTLYAIAFRYDTDFIQLAQINHIQSPYALKVGQVIYLKTSAQRQVSAHRIRPKPQFKLSQQVVRRPLQGSKHIARFDKSTSGTHWVWPVNGRIVNNYAPNHNRKGIDIAGRRGDIVRSSAPGIVAYAGGGLPGYGNLIIIKHEHNLLTAYSHNEKNLVKERQHVKAGQAIAHIGMIDRKFYGLHYEIRQAGHPINPQRYLGPVNK